MMKFKVTLTDEDSMVIGQYEVVIVKELPDEEEPEGTIRIAEEEMEAEGHSLEFAIQTHGEYLGAMIVNDVRAIYLQRKGG